MAENGAGTAEENCCHPPTLDGQAAVADGIDTPMDSVQATGGAALADCAVSEAKSLKLRGGDDAVLVGSEGRDLGVDWVNVMNRNQWFRNVAFTGHGSSVAARASPLNARMWRIAAASWRKRNNGAIGGDWSAPQASFGLRQSSASLARRRSASPSIGTRSWVSESRSRRVIVSSSAVSPSIVIPQGVPISSWRR